MSNTLLKVEGAGVFLFVCFQVYQMAKSILSVLCWVRVLAGLPRM